MQWIEQLNRPPPTGKSLITLPYSLLLENPLPFSHFTTMVRHLEKSNTQQNPPNQTKTHPLVNCQQTFQTRGSHPLQTKDRSYTHHVHTLNQPRHIILPVLSTLPTRTLKKTLTAISWLLHIYFLCWTSSGGEGFLDTCQDGILRYQIEGSRAFRKKINSKNVIS